MIRRRIAQGMERIQADDARPESLSCPRDNLAKVGEVAAPPVAIGRDRIELQGQSPQPKVPLEDQGNIAMTRRKDQPSGGEPSSDETVTPNQHVIVSNGEVVRHCPSNPHMAPSRDKTHFCGDESGTDLTALNAGTVFVTQLPIELDGGFLPIIKRETTQQRGSRLTFSNDEYRLAGLTPAPFFPLTRCCRQRLLRIDTKSHRGQ